MRPPTGANDADKPMPMVERMNRRFLWGKLIDRTIAR
jgi:hypothetical protein